MQNLASRLRTTRLDRGLSQADVARAVGMSQPSYHSLERGATSRSVYLTEIAKVLQVDSYWLLTGKTASDVDAEVTNLLERSSKVGVTSNDNNEERIWIDLVNIRFSCGDGESIEFHFDDVISKRDFPPSFFKKHGVKPENVKLAIAKGDSQEPYICNEDEFAIDISDIEIKEGEFYAIYFEGEAMLKQIFKEEGGRLTLHSLNPKYKDKIVSATNGIGFRVLGRQFYRAG
ncbi:XRE family transcriptional regulator [Acinetobacter guillouiae]|uniref:XRE family transcriptional regulator n=1 Tax=Acinetobacter guillouiae TaxID=106649 RepID=UPI003AF75530